MVICSLYCLPCKRVRRVYAVYPMNPERVREIVLEEPWLADYFQDDLFFCPQEDDPCFQAKHPTRIVFKRP